MFIMLKKEGISMLDTIMTYANNIVNSINDALYSYVLIILLVLCGLYFTVRTGFSQFRLFGHQIKSVTEKPADGKSVSSFQALMVSTASRVGTGNIIGVSTAICLGGFGAIFWMWVIAIIGGASALIESTLAQIYKRKGPDGWYGGPAYYIEAAFKKNHGLGKVIAILFSIFLFLHMDLDSICWHHTTFSQHSRYMVSIMLQYPHG